MTTVANLSVEIGANTRGLQNGLSRTDTQLGNLVNSAQRLSSVMLAGFAFDQVFDNTVGLAMEWESAFTNVAKTVAGTPQELAALEDQLREMATSDVLGSLENAHFVLADIAASAGALGVETSAIDEFTASVAALTVASDGLGAEEIATAAAQFANVTGMDIASEIDNWANSITRLGNEGAATEGNILAFANRMSTLATFSFDPSDILGYSAAMAGLGITAELGGTNFVKTVGEISTAVALGGDKLEGFADAAGLTADEFAALHANDPSAAFDAFIEGLSGMDATDQILTLQNLNITGQEQQTVLMKLAAGYNSVEAALITANEAWASGNDAMDEASKKADTTQGNIENLKNNLSDLGITIGNAVLPGFNDLVESAIALTQGDYDTAFIELGNGVAGVVDGLGELVGLDLNLGEGWQAFLGSLSMVAEVGQILGQGLGDGIAIFFDNMKRDIERFFIDIQLGIVEWVMGARQTILDVTGGRVDIAPEMTVDFSNLAMRGNRMDIADSITDAIATQVGAGGIDLGTLFFQDDLGRTINLSDYMESFEFLINKDELMASMASGFGAEGRQVVTDAIEMALTQGDTGALEVLTPLANVLEIDVDQIQSDLQAQIGAQPYDVTVTANMTVIPGAMNTNPMQAAIGSGSYGTPITVVLNTYGTNPRQTADQIETAASNRGRGGNGRR